MEMYNDTFDIVQQKVFYNLIEVKRPEGIQSSSDDEGNGIFVWIIVIVIIIVVLSIVVFY